MQPNTIALPLTPAAIMEVHERHWQTLVEALGWPLERNAASAKGLREVNALAPGRDFHLRHLTQDGSGRFWESTGEPTKVRNMRSGEIVDYDSLPTPHTWGKFPNETFSWRPCLANEKGEVEENETQIARLEAANEAIRSFIQDRAETVKAAVEAYAQASLENRQVYAAYRTQDQFPPEGEWTNRDDAQEVMRRVHLEHTSVGHEMMSEGRLIIAIHHWLEELSGLPLGVYLC